MEFYQELLLTMFLSILIAFLLDKIVSIASTGDEADRRKSAERDLAAAVLGLHRAKAAATGGEIKVVGGILRESDEEGRGTAEARGYEWTATDVGQKRAEIVSLEEEELAVEGGVDEPEEVRASELGLEKVEEGENIPDVIGGGFEENLVGEGFEENLVRETSEKPEIWRIGLSMAREEEGLVKDGDDEVHIVKEEQRLDEVGVNEAKGVPLVDAGAVKNEGLEGETGGLEKSGNDEKVGTPLNEDDEWEGIERSELEKFFVVASAFMGSADGVDALSKLSNDLQMQLYGLHKVATEGPCYESQPLALKGRELLYVSDGGQWLRCARHAWQRLGSMNPEAAMEQYISILADNIPGWMTEKLMVDSKQVGSDSPDAGISGSGAPALSSPPEDQLIQETQRNPESHSFTEGDDETGVPKDFKQGLPSTDSSSG